MAMPRVVSTCLVAAAAAASTGFFDLSDRSHEPLGLRLRALATGSGGAKAGSTSPHPKKTEPDFKVQVSPPFIESYPATVTVSLEVPPDLAEDDLADTWVGAYRSTDLVDERAPLKLQLVSRFTPAAGAAGRVETTFRFYDNFDDVAFFVMQGGLPRLDTYSPRGARRVQRGPVARRSQLMFTPSQIHVGTFLKKCAAAPQGSDVAVTADGEAATCDRYSVQVQFATQPTPGTTAYCVRNGVADRNQQATKPDRGLIDQHWNVEWRVTPSANEEDGRVRAAGAWPVPSVYAEDMCGSPAKDIGFSELGQFWLAELVDLPEDAQVQYRLVPARATALAAGVAIATEWLSIRSPARNVHSSVIVMDVGAYVEDGSVEVTWTLPQVNSVTQLIGKWRREAEGQGALEKRLDGWVLVGDISYSDGWLAQEALFFNQNQPLLSQMPLAVAMGNHERDYPGSGSLESGTSKGECGVPTQRSFQNLPWSPKIQPHDEPWYAFQSGPVKYYMLSSENSLYSQLSWLNRELKSEHEDPAVSGIYWRVLGMHRPFIVDSNWVDSMVISDQGFARYLRINLAPVAKSVDVIIQGHAHTYQRSCLIDGERSDPNRYSVRDWTFPIGHQAMDEPVSFFEDHLQCSQHGDDLELSRDSPDYLSLLVGTGGGELARVETAETPRWVERIEGGYGASRLFADEQSLRVEFWGAEPQQVLDSVTLRRPGTQTEDVTL